MSEWIHGRGACLAYQDHVPFLFRPVQTSEYNANEKRVIWNIKKFLGATEQMLRIKVCIHF